MKLPEGGGQIICRPIYQTNLVLKQINFPDPTSKDQAHCLSDKIKTPIYETNALYRKILFPARSHTENTSTQSGELFPSFFYIFFKLKKVVTYYRVRLDLNF